MQASLTKLDDQLRRVVDIVVSGLALLLLSPVLIGIGIVVRAQDGGPALYFATRVGRSGRLFKLYKFRTMVVDADKRGPAITVSDDVRVTGAGRWLRRTKLDELPQLINVLVGDMSLVGPRPESPAYVALYTPSQRQVLRAKPGMTSPASLAYRREELILSGPDWDQIYVKNVMPSKLALDIEYLNRRNLLTDLWIVAKTAISVLRD